MDKRENRIENNKENKLNNRTTNTGYLRLLHFLKTNHLLLAIVFFSALLEVYGLCLGNLGYRNENVKGPGSNIALACIKLHEGVFPWSMERQELLDFIDSDWTDENGYTWTESGLNYSDDNQELTNLNDLLEDDNSSAIDDFENKKPESDSGEINIIDDNAVANSDNHDPENLDGGVSENGISEAPIFETVEMSYFEDALFIGDSRMVGVMEYAGIEGATFYARTGMNIYTLMDGAIETDNRVKSVREGLEQNQFGKIYIMVGINELGIGNLAYFMRHYDETIREIREMQPDAIIYLQGIMHVTSEKSRRDQYINNENINERNEAISMLANNEDIFYIDVNPVYDDENGNLNSEMTGDQVHLYATKYGLWRDFYLEHGVVK